MSLAVEAVEINGVVITGRGPASSGEVMLYDRLPQEDTEVVYRVSLKNGFYVLNVPEGEYYIMARAVRDEEHYTGYYGGNPLYVSGDEEIWLPLMAVRDDLPETVPSETTELRGRVLFKDSPVTNAEVSLYLAGSGALRGLGYLTVTTDSEGWFRMNPIGGEYYLIARKRRSGGGIRPLRRGDLYCYYTGNPVTVPEDAAMTVTIRCYPKEDITGFIDGDIRDTVMVKRLKASSTRMRERKPLPEPDMATLKGRVVSSEGPVEGVRVLAYEREDGRAFQMNMIRTMPSFMTVTTSDGRFNLPLSKGREYFLVARQYLGVWPLRGELYGMYEGNVDHFITAGRNSNVTIRVSGVMTPAPGGREPGQGTLISNAWYSDTVIREDTVWKGTITIEGTVVVARGVRSQFCPVLWCGSGKWTGTETEREMGNSGSSAILWSRVYLSARCCLPLLKLHQHLETGHMYCYLPVLTDLRSDMRCSSMPLPDCRYTLQRRWLQIRSSGTRLRESGSEVPAG